MQSMFSPQRHRGHREKICERRKADHRRGRVPCFRVVLQKHARLNGGIALHASAHSHDAKAWHRCGGRHSTRYASTQALGRAGGTVGKCRVEIACRPEEAAPRDGRARNGGFSGPSIEAPRAGGQGATLHKRRRTSERGEPLRSGEPMKGAAARMQATIAAPTHNAFRPRRGRAHGVCSRCQDE